MRCKSALHGALKALYVEEKLFSRSFVEKEKLEEECINMRWIKKMVTAFLLAFIFPFYYKSKKGIKKTIFCWRRKKSEEKDDSSKKG